MRLPQDRDEWTGRHAERAVARAWRLFEAYERRVNFDRSQAETDELYRPYMAAREEALDVARQVHWHVAEAEALP